MSKLVTIGIPVYKRLDYLPEVLRVVTLQDYPHIELIVSDNGMNASKVPGIVEQWYRRPYKFRQNAVSVNIPTHYHQILRDASGEYFLWLADDDLISLNFVSELVRILDNRPEVSVAIAQQEIIDTSGHVIRRASEQLPDYLSGEDFIRSWTNYKFESYATLLARTSEIRRSGGFGNAPHGTTCDDVLLIKLCLQGSVAFSKNCIFQYRWHNTSFGFSINCRQLAEDYRHFLRFLDSDPTILKFAEHKPEIWKELKQRLVTMIWKTYWYRWYQVYRPRLSTLQWITAAFYMPFIPAYYAAVSATFFAAPKEALGARVRNHFPWVYQLYQTFK